ncbi:hypothetical protein AB4589_06755 [Vibrio sp. 10N.222.49.A3]|uniref:hypothetical protein n=1 Tax=Vibrio sp. 10N.222.49.A3 TaxID=3229611 RepID=UPI00355011F7
MKKEPLFKARSKDESDFYVAEVARLVRDRDSHSSIQNGSLIDAENSLLTHFNETEARQHAKLLSLIYQEKINPSDDVLDWINSPRISGFCIMTLLNRPEFQKRYLDQMSMIHSSSLSQYTTETTSKKNVRNARDPYNFDDLEKLPGRKTYDINDYDNDKLAQQDHNENLRMEEPQRKDFIRIKDESFINSLSTGFDADTVIPKSSYGSHRSRFQAILKAFYDLSSAQVKCRGDNDDYRHFNLSEIILRLKFDWQQVFLHASHSWIEHDNADQIAWLHHNLQAKDAEFELPWIITDTESLHDALLTYLDLSFLQHPEDAAKKIETLRKAWVRKNGNDNAEEAKSIGLSSKSKAQLKELSKRKKKSERTVIKELIQEQHSSLTDN